MSDNINLIRGDLGGKVGEQLAQLMIDHGVGVTDVATSQVKRIDTDYFDDE